jgi:hypothetical protein
MSINFNDHDITTSGNLTANSGNFTTLTINNSNFNSSVSGLLPTIANSGDNRVLTSTGSTVGINAESNLSFDGSLLNVTGGVTISSSGTSVPLTITNDGTGNCLVVNDVTGDSTPFIIDSSGNVGIGTDQPKTNIGKSLHMYNDANTGTVASNSYVAIQSVNRNSVIELCGSASAVNALNFSTSLGTSLAGVCSDIANQAIFFRTGGTSERMRITSDGNVGIGTTSPTLNTNGTVLHIHNSTASRASMIRFTNNESGSTATDGLMVGKWSDGTNYIYDYDNYDLILGAHNGNKVRIHSVGTSFYQSANGTPSLGSKNFYAATFENLSAGYGLAIGGVSASTGDTSIQVQNFTTSNAYNLILQPLGGNVGIGTSPAALSQLHQAGTYPTSSNATQVIRQTGTIPSGTTNEFIGVLSAPTTQAASFTLATLRHFHASPQSFGSGSTVTDQYGFVAESTLTGATNNYGFLSAIASGTGRWNFYASGTAANYFAGNVGIGTSGTNFRLVVANNTTDGVWAFSDSSAKSYLGFGGYANSGDGSCRLMYDRAGGFLSFSFGTRDAPSETVRFASSGTVTAVGVYNNTVGATNRDVYVDSGGLLGYVSSIRESKTGIESLNDVSWLSSLNPVSYFYRKRDNDGNYTEELDGTKDYGLIAEEVEQIAPELCFYDIVDDEPQLRGVTYSKLITPMLKYIQVLQQEVNELKSRLTSLEQR